MTEERKTEQTQLVEIGYTYVGKSLLGTIPAEIFTKKISDTKTSTILLYRNPEDKQMMVIHQELIQLGMTSAAEFIWGKEPIVETPSIPNNL